MTRKRNLNKEELEAGIMPEEEGLSSQENQEFAKGITETQRQVQDQFFDGTIDQKYE